MGMWDSLGMEIGNEMGRGRILALKWYTADEASKILEVKPETVKSYLKNRKYKGKQKGPRKQWHMPGSEIRKILTDWNED